MRIGKLTNSISCEYEMQDKMKGWLNNLSIMFLDEFYVKKASRRPDFLLLKNQDQLINIEAKCNDLVCLIRQMQDNAVYCDYSFAFIPDYCNTTRDFKDDLLTNGFGLIIYNFQNKTITEVLEAHFNNPKDRDLRSNICKEVRDNCNK